MSEELSCLLSHIFSHRSVDDRRSLNNKTNNMNKTPIQELIDDLTRRGVFINPSKMTLLIKRSIDAYQQKEKQFGFDCFEAGMQHGMDICTSIDWGDNPIEPNFKQFYSQYTQQQKQ